MSQSTITQQQFNDIQSALSVINGLPDQLQALKDIAAYNMKINEILFAGELIVAYYKQC